MKSKFLQSLLFLQAKIMQIQLVVMQIDLDNNKIKWLHRLKCLIGGTDSYQSIWNYEVNYTNSMNKIT